MTSLLGVIQGLASRVRAVEAGQAVPPQWATVTQVSPLRVQIDGEDTALAVAPENLAGPLVLAQRVLVQAFGRRVAVLGPPAFATPGANLFANPIFRVSQRGVVSGTSLAAGQYFVDRMRSSVAANAVTWTGDDTAGRVLTIPAGKYIGSLQERSDYPAGTYTLSWGGTSQGRFWRAGLSAPAFAASPVTVTSDGLADMVAEWGAGTLSWVKIERGPVATPLALTTVAAELDMCRRYYRLLAFPASTFIGAGAYWSTTNAVIVRSIDPPMRAAPTITFSPVSTFEVLATNANRPCTAVTASGVTAGGFGIDCTTATPGGNSAGATLRAMTVSPFSTAYIGLEAEL